MSIENSAIHYIKDTMFGDFYLNNPLENKPLGRIFCQMVEFKSLENITYLSPTSVFMQDMLEAFEEFDKNLNPPGLITQQFTALAQKCADKGVKLLIGENNRLPSIQFPKQVYDKKYIFVNISKDLVKEAMWDPIYVIQQEGNNVPEIKAIPLGNLVAGTMVTDFDDPILTGKCAAYLLFHELFHANSFLNHVENYDWNTSTYNSTMEASIRNYAGTFGILEEQVKLMVNKSDRFDDLRNVTGAKTGQEIRVPGEYELLQALYPNKRIMRLYEGKFLDFSNSKVLEAAVKVARFENGPLNPQQLSENEKLRNKINTFLNGKEVLLKKFESNTDSPYKEFVFNYKSIQKTNKELNDFIENSLNFVKVDNSIWETRANQYIQVITEKLEEIQKQEDMQSGAYISNK